MLKKPSIFIGMLVLVLFVTGVYLEDSPTDDSNDHTDWYFIRKNQHTSDKIAKY